jgi:hypothetical protein
MCGRGVGSGDAAGCLERLVAAPMVVLCEFPGLDLARLVTLYNMMLCDGGSGSGSGRWCSFLVSGVP